MSLIDALWFSHGTLDVQRSDVLPVFLQQRYEEVDTKSDVVYQVLICHSNVTDGDGNTQGL